MGHYARRVFTAIPVFSLIAGVFMAPMAQAQSQSQTQAVPNAEAETDPLALFSQEGFDANAVHAFLTDEVGMTGEVRALDTGELYGAYETEDGRPFMVVTEFCDGGVCLGLLFAAYFPSALLNGDLADLNAFNAVYPHGNVAYNAELDAIVLQRVITNIGGLTNGSFAGEVGVFQGYLEVFTSSIVGPELVADRGADRSAGAPLASPISDRVKAAFADMADNLPANKIYNGLN